MQTVLITGANGFVGVYLTSVLVEKNYKVVATGRGKSRMHIKHKNLQYQELDFTDEQNLKEVLEQHKPTIVVHAGALSKPDDCKRNKELAYLTNTIATQHLLKYATLHKSFFIFLSTDFIFDGKRGMYSEEDIPAPVNYYGETKLLAEAAVKEYEFKWCIVRTVLVYGNPKGGRHNLLTLVAEKLKNGESYKVFNDQIRTPTYVEDLTRAIATIIDNRATGIYHISGKDVATPFDMAVATAKYLSLDENRIEAVTAESFNQGAKRPAKTGFIIAKAEKELGYKPITFEEGVRKTFE